MPVMAPDPNSIPGWDPAAGPMYPRLQNSHTPLSTVSVAITGMIHARLRILPMTRPASNPRMSRIGMRYTALDRAMPTHSAPKSTCTSRMTRYMAPRITPFDMLVAVVRRPPIPEFQAALDRPHRVVHWIIHAAGGRAVARLAARAAGSQRACARHGGTDSGRADHRLLARGRGGGRRVRSAQAHGRHAARRRGGGDGPVGPGVFRRARCLAGVCPRGGGRLD